MGAISPIHWAIIALVLVWFVFGGGRFSRILGDIGLGIKNVKREFQEDKHKADS